MLFLTYYSAKSIIVLFSVINRYSLIGLIISNFLSYNIQCISSTYVVRLVVILLYCVVYFPLPYSIITASSCILISLANLVYTYRLPRYSLQANITIAIFGLNNPKPIAFLYEYKTAHRKVVPNLIFCAIVLLYFFCNFICY